MSKALRPSTLNEAHSVLLAIRPKPGADAVAWRDFHRHCAEIYTRVAEIDGAHRHEARAWAAEARRAADG